MTQELSLPQECIVLRNGMKHWVSVETAEKIKSILASGNGKFIRIEETNIMINIADVTGVFNPQAMEDYDRTKQGQVQCKYGNWHSRDEVCQCGWHKVDPPKNYELTDEQRAKNLETMAKMKKDFINRGIFTPKNDEPF